MIEVITAADFDAKVLGSAEPCIAFFAGDNDPSANIEKVLNEIFDEGETKETVYKINVADAADLAAEYGAKNPPVLIMFEGGQKGRNMIGYRPKPRVKQLFADLA